MQGSFRKTTQRAHRRIARQKRRPPFAKDAVNTAFLERNQRSSQIQRTRARIAHEDDFRNILQRKESGASAGRSKDDRARKVALTFGIRDRKDTAALRDGGAFAGDYANIRP